ncbi:MAG: cytochrome c [Phycisphaerae bacterium]|nr:cytochrome c [Phycisphaerae bacterium]NIP54026.1 cytochrome c [Phycisphaerae bacterium]NIU10437.1 cytochrome c [Phycisphaerae bacterium]NIX27361.1 c-type cytochrome [Phycisphaerae bacterium]
MLSKTFELLALLFLLLTLNTINLNADEGHAHNDDKEQKQKDMEGHTNDQMHGHTEDQAHHSHDQWIVPPEEYANKQFHGWTDIESIQRGEAIYNAQCLACHGADGQGTGPVASSLDHMPADLNNNFHDEPGMGDAYLFWRVSEGGAVEPFKSQNSAMPAFKSVLTESERWDVLAYIHTFFHRGLAAWNNGNSQQ